MSTETTVQNLKINKLTKAQFDTITPSATEAYELTDLSSILDGKQATLVSGTNIKTINNESILGSGNITISGGGSSSGLVYTTTNPALTPSSGVASWQVTHNLNTTAVQAVLYSGSQEIDKNVTIDSANAVTVSFPASSSVSAGSVKIVVLASGANADTSNLANKSLSNINNTAKIAIANNSRPSSTSKSLTVGASGTSYQAPADGYFAACAWGNSSICWMELSTDGWMQSGTYGSSNLLNYKVWMPIRKGASATLSYDGMRDVVLHFNYAVGAVSEAS